MEGAATMQRGEGLDEGEEDVAVGEGEGEGEEQAAGRETQQTWRQLCSLCVALPGKDVQHIHKPALARPTTTVAARLVLPDRPFSACLERLPWTWWK